ncbi:hypothetical protein J5N97_014139 [Dioscorea zingiberensis]|uniref:Uncharacterized protein n=1 Tax=Dioscorea zingiberensis TaxID=325984 RepID=A0A9D5CRT5_9LILI|nr:hypothetical protein J5N97_014139 [Dioscorea zingiberensis]
MIPGRSRGCARSAPTGNAARVPSWRITLIVTTVASAGSLMCTRRLRELDSDCVVCALDDQQVILMFLDFNGDATYPKDDASFFFMVNDRLCLAKCLTNLLVININIILVAWNYN